IVDLSVSGVAVVSLARPPLGSAVRVGKAPGRGVRYLDNGFAVEFARVLAPDALKTTISPTSPGTLPPPMSRRATAAPFCCPHAGTSPCLQACLRGPRSLSPQHGER